MAKSYKWTFKARFRTKAYGWNGTALATKRLREAVSEIKKVGRKHPVLAGEGVVSLLERIWPSLQAIDGSSGALGGAVYRTLSALIPLLIAAPADLKTRTKWIDRLYEAICDDGVDYLSPVQERWGEICEFADLANKWADDLLPLVRDKWIKNDPFARVVGETICLSCLVETKRYKELEELTALRPYKFWHFDQFWANALLEQGLADDAISFAESCRQDRIDYDSPVITEFCERVLLEAGRCDEAYERYGLLAPQATTNLTTFRKITKKYPDRDSRQILTDLIDAHGLPGKWFAAAKDAGFLDIALECAKDRSSEPATLIRAARDFTDRDPDFAAQVALCALRNLFAGSGYEPTTIDVLHAYQYLIAAANQAGISDWARTEIERLLKIGAARGLEPFQKVVQSYYRLDFAGDHSKSQMNPPPDNRPKRDTHLSRMPSKSSEPTSPDLAAVSAVQYVNRKDDRYYLHQGRTKTGKQRYFFSKRSEGELCEQLPNGFEIYENIRGQVFCRRIQPKLITDQEIALVQKIIRRCGKQFSIAVDVKGKDVIVYEQQHPCLKFTLCDEDERLFMPYRWCFRGSIDDWIVLYGLPGSLPDLAEEYCPHIGEESFFELM